MKLQISQPIHWIEEIDMKFSMAFNQYAFNTKVDANETVDKSPAGLIKLLPSRVAPNPHESSASGGRARHALSATCGPGADGSPTSKPSRV
jgi:hypothetical protein